MCLDSWFWVQVLFTLQDWSFRGKHKGIDRRFGTAVVHDVDLYMVSHHQNPKSNLQILMSHFQTVLTKPPNGRAPDNQYLHCICPGPPHHFVLLKIQPHSAKPLLKCFYNWPSHYFALGYLSMSSGWQTQGLTPNIQQLDLEQQARFMSIQFQFQHANTLLAAMLDAVVKSSFCCNLALTHSYSLCFVWSSLSPWVMWNSCSSQGTQLLLFLLKAPPQCCCWMTWQRTT